MKFTILAFGTQGDIQPLVALGHGLKRAGHSVAVATDKNFEPFVTAHQLDFRSIAGDIRALMQGQAGQDLVAQGQDPGAFARNLSQMIRPVLMQMMADCWRVCQGSDVILPSQWGNYFGIPIADKLRIPVVKCNLVPMTPTRALPSAQMPPPKHNWGGLYNYVTGFMTEQFFWQTFRPAINAAREQVLQMPPDSFWGPSSQQARGRPLLYGFSTHVVPRPSDWSANIQVTGYWLINDEEQWQPPADLMDFLNAGTPPVYIGFGSMNNRDPRQTAALVIRALAVTDRRGILLRGWGGLSESDLPESILMVDSVPHDWLFPRMAVVVHHGGAGTTATSLSAGIPTLIIPFMNDQSFWAWRVEKLGVGPRAIPRRELTSENLARAIDQALHDATMRAKAAGLGEVLRAEDGVATAVSAINSALH